MTTDKNDFHCPYCGKDEGWEHAWGQVCSFFTNQHNYVCAACKREAKIELDSHAVEFSKIVKFSKIDS